MLHRLLGATPYQHMFANLVTAHFFKRAQALNAFFLSARKFRTHFIAFYRILSHFIAFYRISSHLPHFIVFYRISSLLSHSAHFIDVASLLGAPPYQRIFAILVTAHFFKRAQVLNAFF
jgi:hypothetical protein